MRTGRWSKTVDFGEGSAAKPGFPAQPDWFRDNRDFPNIARGLRDIGFSEQETAKVLGENWLRFFATGFVPGDPQAKNVNASSSRAA
jgi:microsomal dipeptidase-like Zn-dependent dipeptidase